jgi:hypothetical protein
MELKSMSKGREQTYHLEGFMGRQITTISLYTRDELLKYDANQ